MEHIEIAYKIYREDCESRGLEPLDYTSLADINIVKNSIENVTIVADNIDFIIEQGVLKWNL